MLDEVLGIRGVRRGLGRGGGLAPTARVPGGPWAQTPFPPPPALFPPLPPPPPNTYPTALINAQTAYTLSSQHGPDLRTARDRVEAPLVPLLARMEGAGLLVDAAELARQTVRRLLIGLGVD